MSPKKSKSNTHGLRQTTLFHSFTGSSPQTPGRRSSRSKIVPIESSSDELEAREIRLPKRALSNSPASNLDAISDAESHVQPLRTSSKRRRTFIASDSSDDQGKVTADRSSSLPVDESSYVDGDSPSRKGKLVHRREIKKHLLASDDSEDLADEVDEERMLDSRLRTRDKKTVFQKNLEKLKRRKLKMDKESDSDQQEESEGSEELETVFKPFRGSKPSADCNSLANDEESDSDQQSAFIIEDDDEVELPAQFSMQTYGDLSYQFKKIFQLFVHVAVQSPGDRHAFMERQMQDEYFAVPIQMTRRKVSGLRDSLVSSSVWRPEFKRALEDYPDFELTPLDFTVPSCDACNMGGRKSSLVGRVGGSLYKVDGFEPRVSKRKTTNNKEFNLGRFCARRGRVFHQFSHWEHSLFQTIVRELDELRLSSSSHGFHRVAYPGGRDPPKDLQDADGLCDWLDERKLIEMEWHKMKEMMESARHLEINAKNIGDL